MSSKQERPLSPHLTIWKWGWHMRVSILHRITGGALTVIGLAILAWWLAAIAGGELAYERFAALADHWSGVVVLVGLTWAFWQHFFSGLRHLVLDTGSGYELRINRFWSVMTIVGSVFATALSWAYFTGYMSMLMAGGVQ